MEVLKCTFLQNWVTLTNYTSLLHPHLLSPSKENHLPNKDVRSGASMKRLKKLTWRAFSKNNWRIDVVCTAYVATFNYKCYQCDTNFKNEEALNTHMMNNHRATEINNMTENVRLFQCETCEFESINIDEIEAHIKIHIPLHISLPKSPLKKQDFGAFAHPPLESTFKHCLLRGPHCQRIGNYYN